MELNAITKAYYERLAAQNAERDAANKAASDAHWLSYQRWEVYENAPRELGFSQAPAHLVGVYTIEQGKAVGLYERDNAVWYEGARVGRTYIERKVPGAIRIMNGLPY